MNAISILCSRASFVRAMTVFMLASWSATASAQTFTTLKHLSSEYSPFGELLIVNNTIYGTTLNASVEGAGFKPGAIFAMSTDGSIYSKLTNFSGTTMGGSPYAGVVQLSNVLYGTTYSGGDWDYGTLFKVGMDGTGYTVLRHLIPNDGYHLSGSLITDGATIYGTTYGDYPFGGGKVFKIKTDGTGFTVLKSFSFFSNIYTNADGANPDEKLVLSAGVLYGSASRGGNSGAGVLFKVTTNGTEFAVLKHFGSSGLTLAEGVLYGTTASGGVSGYGTVFRMNTDGTDYAVLNYFAQTNGASPHGSLVLAGSSLYGTTRTGGTWNYGTVFKVNTNGNGFNVLKHFSGNDGQQPNTGLTLSGTTLYGTTESGGNAFHGTVFKIELSLPLHAQTRGNAVVLTWTNAAFALQSAPEPAGVFTNVPGATSPYTNDSAASQLFFRLINN